MTGAIEELLGVYHEWKVLTEKEGVAIRESDWAEVRETQNEKRALQSEIIHLTEKVQSGFSSKADQVTFDTRLRSMVNELILLETRNNGVLQGCLDVAHEQKRGLDATSTRLRQVHNRYVPTRDPVWENLS